MTLASYPTGLLSCAGAFSFFALIGTYSSAAADGAARSCETRMVKIGPRSNFLSWRPGVQFRNSLFFEKNPC